MRTKVEAELTAKLSSQMQERLKAEQTKFEEQVRQGSGRRAHEELVWVRHNIRRGLERERGVMREPVGRATGRVRMGVGGEGATGVVAAAGEVVAGGGREI